MDKEKKIFAANFKDGTFWRRLASVLCRAQILYIIKCAQLNNGKLKGQLSQKVLVFKKFMNSRVQKLYICHL